MTATPAALLPFTNQHNHTAHRPSATQSNAECLPSCTGGLHVGGGKWCCRPMTLAARSSPGPRTWACMCKPTCMMATGRTLEPLRPSTMPTWRSPRTPSPTTGGHHLHPAWSPKPQDCIVIPGLLPPLNAYGALACCPSPQLHCRPSFWHCCSAPETLTATWLSLSCWRGKANLSDKLSKCSLRLELHGWVHWLQS